MPARRTPAAARRRPSGRPPVGTGSAAWTELARAIRACRACPLGGLRTHAVVYRGAPRPHVVFVGEAPGAEEDRAGRPFVGRGGQRLDAALAEAGIDPAAIGFLNLLKCRPPGNRFDAAAARTCRPFLDRQLALLRPGVLVPLGARALRALAPEAPGITECAGRPLPSDDPAIFPLLHPAAPLHDPRLRARWAADVGALGRHLRERADEIL